MLVQKQTGKSAMHGKAAAQQSKKNHLGEEHRRPPPMAARAGDLVCKDEGDYALLDLGNGKKLERFGDVRLVRPEPQAMVQPRLDEAAWRSADAVFEAASDSEGGGKWRSNERAGRGWNMRFDETKFQCRLTRFRHVGVFPEQAPHWRWMKQRLDAGGRRTKLLNLFAYTGIASILAAQSGAAVTHIDASSTAISWARENQKTSDAQDLPIRWITEDAMRFVERELRRGNRYDAIILDPPKFGRGPRNETWDLFTGLPPMMRAARALLSDDAQFIIVTAYAIRAGYCALQELLAQELAGLGGCVEAGELLLEESDDGAAGPPAPRRRLATSLYARWSAG